MFFNDLLFNHQWKTIESHWNVVFQYRLPTLTGKKLAYLIENWDLFRRKLINNDKVSKIVLVNAKKFFEVDDINQLPDSKKKVMTTIKKLYHHNLPSKLYCSFQEIYEHEQQSKKIISECIAILTEHQQTQLRLEQKNNARAKLKEINTTYLQHQAHLDIKAEAYAINQIENDPFYKQINIIPALEAEKNRILNQKKRIQSDHVRISALKTTQNAVALSLQTAHTEYKKEYFIKHNGGHSNPDRPMQIKQNCKDTIANAVQEKLINNDSLGEHRRWGTRFGRCLLNISFFINGLAIAKYAVTGSPFFSLKTQSQKNVNDIYKTIKNIPVINKTGPQ